MGVDYSGNYGIGVKVLVPELEEEHDYFDDELGYVDNLLKDTEYEYFEVGDGSYSGKKDDLYICFKNPFKDGYNIEDKVIELYLFLSNTDLEVIGKVNEVGGLRVW